MGRDELLMDSIPKGMKIHKVKALSKTLTTKVGLGSIALRSMWYYRRYVDKLLARQHFDLIYFSTTQFPVLVLGAHWKKKFGMPYVIDMQDPWHSDYYRDKPKAQQPPKYWFSYRLNKYLEPIALKRASGLISVSQDYINDLNARYPVIQNIPAATITFGMFAPDMDIATAHKSEFAQILSPGYTNIVYIGRGGNDMHAAIAPVFQALKAMPNHDAINKKQLKLYFIGTSYAPTGQGKNSIMPLAEHYGVADLVTEITDRISYYHTLATLLQADALFIPGSDDAKYTASKIYPYLLTGKPLLGIFNPQSSAIEIIKEFGINTVYGYDTVNADDIHRFIGSVIDKTSVTPALPPHAMAKHSAQTKTALQCSVFNQAIRYEQS
ncbi:hypothetical protein E2R66_01395 [Mucilaginibacter psychrotolerans]|uniref:Glycosyltransferase subfamily 4-like N-terminal domain-containing protein n=2 Tax=Mucilaginibacter psychrotolerans TaxID=1524096 RepID=A0A4Y8SQE7_9SPHI|nr:hypothetical protein E2R66_01395 [Mucilaginibacter psychrotolerans]